MAWNFLTPCISTCPDDLVTAFATAPWRNAKQAQPTVKPPGLAGGERGKANAVLIKCYDISIQTSLSLRGLSWCHFI